MEIQSGGRYTRHLAAQRSNRCFQVRMNAILSRITYVSVNGSIHMDVPVKPVWPKEPTGNRSPRLPENCESISHPSPRRIGWSAGPCGVVNFRTVNGLKMRTPFR